jgi:hypothetical protein
MKDPCDDIRDWMYTVLNGTVSYGGSAVPVYSFPPENVSYPYMVIGEHSSEGEEGAKDRYMMDVATQLHIYTRHTGTDASYLPVNTIGNSVLQLLRTRATANVYGYDEGPTKMNNFNVIRVRVGAMNTDRILNDNEIIISKQVSINLLLEEN